MFGKPIDRAHSPCSPSTPTDRYYVNHRNTELPVQLLLPAAHIPNAVAPQQLQGMYAGERQRRSTEDKLRAWAGVAPPTLPQVSALPVPHFIWPELVCTTITVPMRALDPTRCGVVFRERYSTMVQKSMSGPCGVTDRAP